jgi:CRP-like cAMP-binding protein
LLGSKRHSATRRQGRRSRHCHQRFPFRNCSPDGIFGELSLIDQEERIASAIARTDCTLQVIDKRHFLFLVQENPLFAIQVMKVMADRLRRVDILIADSDFDQPNRVAEG